VKTGFRIAVALIVTAGCLYFALRGAEWEDIRAVLARTRYEWVAAMAVVSVLAVYIRALRWQVLLEPVGQVSVRPLFSATAVGFMANMLLPLRAGEVIRPVMVGRQTAVPTSAAFASVVLERLLDGLLLFCLLIAISLAVPVPEGMRRAGYVLAAVIAVVVAGLVALLRYRERAILRVRRSLDHLPRRLGPRIGDVLESFVAGLSGINDGRTVAVVFAYSLAVWLVIAATFGCALLALDVGAPLAAASVSLMIMVAAFVSLPQAPGYLGTWQAGCVAALTFYGVSRSEAIGLSLVTHVTQVLVIVALGAACLAADNMGLRELASLARTQERGS
jgi:uncharacterized protein (TIRG00374 family)